MASRLTVTFETRPLHLTLQAKTQRANAPAPMGAVVHQLEKASDGSDGQAEKLGVRRGDVLITVNGTQVGKLRTKCLPRAR